MTVNEAIEKLNELENTEFAYHHAMGMLDYDGVTGAPKDSCIPRGKTLGYLAGVIHSLSTGEDTVRLLDYLKEHEDQLPAAVRRRVELKRKQLKELRSIPADEYVGYTQLLNDASAVWHEAKEKSDYAMFEPYLGRIIEANKRFAFLVEPDMIPYDYCLGKYEEGLTMEKCDKFFGAIKEPIVKLIEKVKSAQEPSDELLKVYFPVNKQHELALRLMDIMGIDRDRCSLGVTEHPFTTDFSKYDVRITTKYIEDNFLSSIYSVVHEGGHALYELHTADEYQYTCLGGGVSMGVHESQSRFYENLIGRSRQYIDLIYPELVKFCPELSKYSANDIYRLANKATPSLIRTEADELTYSLHIMVRYEMERAFINGTVPTKELPDMWNALYREYLGVDVPNDRDGILQDSHWSGGTIGYFPSYALGSAYGAQLLSKMKETVNVEDCVKLGDFAPINGWLEDRIWRHGSFYKPTEVIEKAMEAPFDPKYFLDYLERKMADVYGF